MLKLIKDWWIEPAEWWQFWLPHSGFTGGLITASIVLTIKWGIS